MKDILKNDWNDLLKNEFQKDYYKKMKAILIDAYKNKNIFPDMYDIFNALHFTSYQNTKVVILGQDPYHGKNQAHGLSFSVNPGIKIPPSLRNIYKELNSDLGCYIPNNGYLKKWADQGVLLLNTTLTVEEGKAASHKNLGWTIFTDEIIKILNNKKTPIVFILWGAHAIKKKSLITNPNHFIIESVHPSPLSASRGFFGSKPFSKTNKFLNSIGEKEIDWQIENI